MKPTFASAAGTGVDLDLLLRDLVARAVSGLGGDGPPDLAMLFVTGDFGAATFDAGPRVLDLTGARHLLGCTASGVIGAEGEFEGGHAAALLLARLPGTALEPFALDAGDVRSMAGLDALPGLLGLPAGGAPTFLLLADPFTTPMDEVLDAFHFNWPGRAVSGGLASGGMRPGANALWLDGRILREGAVGFALTGATPVRPLVSQGCRPVGQRYTVTRADGPRLGTLAGRPALEVLRDTVEGLSEEDRRLARTSLHLGRVAHEAKAEFRRGDFLIRNLVAAVPAEGVLIVGDALRTGFTVQFQLRDADTAREDLEEMLDHALEEGAPAAALLFSCGGRGSHLFSVPDHDLHLIQGRFGRLPLAGFFCAGEIGPVGPRPFLHGFTASLALLG